MRQEAVQQALAAMQGKTKPVVPLPSKRSSVAVTRTDKDDEDEETGRNQGRKEGRKAQFPSSSAIPSAINYISLSC